MIGRLTLTLTLLTVPFAAAAQDESGQVAFNNHCRTCHSTDEGDNRLGPSLHGIVGREAGSVEGYKFSAALAKADLVWDEETLDAFIADPASVVQGNEMRPYGGITDPETRAAIVGFLAGQ